MRLRLMLVVLAIAGVSTAMAGFVVMTLFSEPAIYVTGLEPLDVVLADVNGDGDLDVLTANREGFSLTVFLGDGDGGLGRAEAVELPWGATSLTVADMNADDVPDVVVSGCERNCTRSSIGVLHGDGHGGFALADTIPMSGIPYNVAVADLDGDPRPDIVASDYPGGRLLVLLTDDLAEGYLEVFLPTAQKPVALQAVDIDGDGWTDLISSDLGGGVSSVYLSYGDGTFSERVAIETGELPYAITLAHLDGDRIVDLAVAHSTEPGRISVHQGRGDGTFAFRQNWELPGRPIFIQAADFNADGYPELAITRHGDSVAGVFVNESDGLFDPEEIPVAAQSAIYSLALADLDADSHPDLVAVDFSTATLTVARGTGLKRQR